MITIMSTAGRSPHLLFMLIVLFSLLSVKIVSGFNSGIEDDHTIKCIERERHALLMIKQSLIDDYGLLSSWGPEDDKKDCCKWHGVSCSNRTSHVVKLNLQTSDDDFGGCNLRGNLSSSILELQQLNYLNLSYNEFGGQPIPEFIGSLNKLRHLDLSYSGFGGRVPYQLGNLSRLQSLDLGVNFGMYAGKLEWLSHLSFLRHLRLSYVNLTQAVDWLQVISELPSLTEVRLIWCNLPSVTFSSSISLVNSSQSLSLVDLSGNDLSNSNSIYVWLSNFSSSLVDLYLILNNLQGPILEFAFSNMTALQSLDLLGNQIDGISPEAFANTCSLKTLGLHSNSLTVQLSDLLFNLSGCTKHSLETLFLGQNKLQGPISKYAFSNMTALQSLDLSDNQIDGISPEAFANTCSLKTLRLDSNNLTVQFLDLLFNLSSCTKHSLETLFLGQNKLQGPISKYAFSNMTALQSIDLSSNQIDGISPEAFVNTCSLKLLNLYSNNLAVQLSDLLFNLSDCTKHSLETLFLNVNMLCGSLPDFSDFISLKELQISHNQLNALTPSSIGQLLKLEVLDISSNSLEGTITEAHMSNLPQLKHLDLSSNLLTFNFTSSWVPRFQLQFIRLQACKLGPHFPKWLLTQKNYSWLDISNSSISDTIPIEFWELSPNLVFLNLSYNHMKGILPDLSLKFANFPGLDLSSNNFEGPIRLFSSNVTSLNLSQNKFSGSISFICLVSEETLSYLDLSNNLLSGELPNCSWPIKNLLVLNLANNNFSEKFPDLMGPKCSLQMLKLRNNHFIGELPSSFSMCSELEIFDVGNNKFSGTIPVWIGDSLPNLIILVLRSNQFNGSIPLEVCKPSLLQLVDLSLNNISGTIPKCLNNLTAMVQSSNLKSTVDIEYGYSISGNVRYIAGYKSTTLIMWKGMDREYKENLGYLKCIDLSSNKLSGEIPIEITSLMGIRSLNLSRNSLTGSITAKFDNFTLLDSLDLSNNKLIGEIPPSFSSLNFLGTLDLSNNNLSGIIPFNTKLQSFEAHAYMGNPYLCGLPLPNKCSQIEVPTSATHGGSAMMTHDYSDDDVILTLEFYVCLAIGFIVGFWSVLGSLILNRSWRHAYFQFLNHVKDRLYLAMVLNIAKLQRWPMARSLTNSDQRHSPV